MNKNRTVGKKDAVQLNDTKLWFEECERPTEKKRYLDIDHMNI